MAEVNLSAVKDAIRTAVQRAAEAGTLEEVTIGETRDAVEKELGLEPGTLKAAEYKVTVKEMIATATEEVERVEEAAPPLQDKSQGKKRKSAPNKIAPKPTPKARSKAVEKASEQKAKTGEPKRSPYVVSIDNEDQVETHTGQAGSSKPAPVKPAVEEPRKRRKKGVSDDEEEENEGKEARSVASTSAGTLDTPPDDADDNLPAQHGNSVGKSDSEMSVLIDEPPKQRRKKAQENKPTKGRKKKGPAEELSKDDQQIKRLKSFVVACGVRKVWAKEFKDVDSKLGQIKHLKQMLTALGMNGRLSMEQAKAIKEKREFEQELEDVKQFERSVISGPRQTRGGRLTNKKSQDVSDDEMSDIPVKPKGCNQRSQPDHGILGRSE